ncbi:MAG: hypothetical protein M1817_006649 [Caeruleum heppii]|nr:MAG: hypothetical protein M1817_006649 [Caeruleum heppii]
MPDSALVGQPPKTPDDLAIVKGFIKMMGVPSTLDPAKGISLGPKATPNSPHDTRAPSLIAALSVATALVIFFTGSRLLVRRFCTRMEFGWDDWMIIPGALLVVVFLNITTYLAVNGCSGAHTYDCTYWELEAFFRSGSIGQTVFFLASGFIKISIALFNRRLTGIASKKWLYIHNTILVILVIYMIASFCLNLFGCKPYDVRFDMRKWAVYDKVTCAENFPTQQALNTFHGVTDVVLFVVPVIVVSRLQMSWGKKLRLSLVFAVGLVSLTAAIMRIYLAFKLGKDITYDFVEKLAWGTVDITTGAIVANLPALNAIFTTATTKVLSRSLHSRVSLSRLFSRGGSGHSGRNAGNTEEKPEQDFKSADSRKQWMHREDDFELGYSSIPEGKSSRDTSQSSKQNVALPPAVVSSPLTSRSSPQNLSTAAREE